MILHSEVTSLHRRSPVEAETPTPAQVLDPTGEFTPAEKALEPGDKVRIGGGSTVWEIQELWTTADGDLATLHSGWNSTRLLVLSAITHAPGGRA